MDTAFERLGEKNSGRAPRSVAHLLGRFLCRVCEEGVFAFP